MGCGASSDGAGPGNYKVIKVLGAGASCEVSKVSEKSTGRVMAMKKMSNDPNVGNIEELFETEIAIMTTLKDNPHPHVLEFIDAFKTSSHFYILLQLCNGGELFERVIEPTVPLTEKHAARFAYMMINSVAHCHKLNIVHRDLKPENYVFVDPSADSPMKLIDFGCARAVEDNSPVNGVCGSLFYMSPAVVKAMCSKTNTVITGATWKAADMWSVGVIIYLFIVGVPPFYDHNQRSRVIFSKILKGHYTWPAGREINESVKDLVSKLLVLDPTKRLTAEQALQHPWVKGESASDSVMDSEAIKSLQGFQSMCRLKRAVARVLRNNMSDEDKQEVQEMFNKFDKNGDGRLDMDEIAEMMKAMGQGSEEAHALMKDIDEDADGHVDLEEFQMLKTAGLVGKGQKEMENQFQMFDINGDGMVTQAELEELLGENGRKEVAKVFKEYDTSGDGGINFEEWVAAMGKTRNTVVGAT